MISSKAYTQQELLRLIARKGPVPAVLERCLREGDGLVHRRLLDSFALPEDVLERLADGGASRAVRNLARETLRRGKRPRAED
jgi:hypothetical protein